jgi:cell division topological specificity factor
MSLFNPFRPPRTKTASIAKERLQIIVAHERSQRNGPAFLPLLQKELLEVIRKYVNIEPNQVKVHVEVEGEREILELNVTIPDQPRPSAP